MDPEIHRRPNSCRVPAWRLNRLGRILLLREVLRPTFIEDSECGLLNSIHLRECARFGILCAVTPDLGHPYMSDGLVLQGGKRLGDTGKGGKHTSDFAAINAKR